MKIHDQFNLGPALSTDVLEIGGIVSPDQELVLDVTGQADAYIDIDLPNTASVVKTVSVFISSQSRRVRVNATGFTTCQIVVPALVRAFFTIFDASGGAE